MMDKDTKDILASMGIDHDHLNRKLRIVKAREKARLEAEERAAKDKRKHKYSRNDD